MELNESLKVLATVSPEGVRMTYPEYDAHYHRMQQMTFVVAKLLMTMPQGTLADLGGREFLAVAPYRGKLEVVALQDYDDSREEDNVFWNFLGPVPYADVDMGGEEQLDEYSATIEKWLAAPTFHQMVPADKLDQLILKAEQWAIDYEAEKKAERDNLDRS